MQRIPTLSTCGFLFSFALISAGCADEAEPSTDKVSARSGWQSTENALGQAGIQTGWSGAGTVDPSGVSGMVTGAMECPDGGSMEVESTGVVNDLLVSGAVVVDFYGCDHGGVIINGSLEYEGRVTETDVVGSIHGDLEWSGDAEGSCAIDLQASVSAAGVSVGGSAVSGQMCGYAWTELF